MCIFVFVWRTSVFQVEDNEADVHSYPAYHDVLLAKLMEKLQIAYTQTYAYTHHGFGAMPLNSQYPIIDLQFHVANLKV